MGVVYKATDTKLERTVALKFLAAHAIEDPEHKARFVREAKAAARLDHQNICPIYEIDEVDGQMFLAMAFLEGQTLKDKIAERPLKLDEALDIAVQTAQGLKAAHQNEVVHRDIKPANLMLTEEGQVKIMDFGLAQLADRSRLTKTTTMLGTPAYMSPEQSQRLPTDRRTDIWSLGVVIYEMVTGRLPFEGERQEAVLYAIGAEDPEPITALRVGVPTELDRIVGKAMAKSPDERYQHVEEMIVDLRGLSHKLESGKSVQQPSSTASNARPAPAARPMEQRQRHQSAALAVMGVLLAVAIGVIALMWFRERVPEKSLPVRKFTFTPPSNTTHAAISPDGRHIAYVTRGVEYDEHTLWIRSFDSSEPREIESAEIMRSPCWSPGSDSVAVNTGAELKKIAVQGAGSVVTLCKMPGTGGFHGCSWSPDGGSIVFSSGPPNRLYEVPARGGRPKLLIEPDESEKDKYFFAPHFLPLEAGGSRLLFSVGNYSEAEMVIEDLETSVRQTLGIGNFAAFSPSGHILYQPSANDRSTLFALPLSPRTLELAGEAFPVAEKASFPTVSKDGTLVYLARGDTRYQLVWRNRDGRKLGEIGQPQRAMTYVSLSPNSRYVAVRGREDDTPDTDVWIHDTVRGIKTRLALDPVHDSRPVWSPTGRDIAYSSYRGAGAYAIFVKPADGSGEKKMLLAEHSAQRPDDWSSDGKHLLYTAIEPNSQIDLWYLTWKDDGSGFETVPFSQTSSREENAKFSPDVKFVAFCSDESGRYEVYVRPFPKGLGKWRVSHNGGIQPRWSEDGKELYYVEDDTLMAVGVTTSPEFSSGPPKKLFQSPVFLRGAGSPDYDVSPDGRRFVVPEQIAEEGSPSVIHIVENWDEEFRER